MDNHGDGDNDHCVLTLGCVGSIHRGREHPDQQQRDIPQQLPSRLARLLRLLRDAFCTAGLGQLDPLSFEKLCLERQASGQRVAEVERRQGSCRANRWQP